MKYFYCISLFLSFFGVNGFADENITERVPDADTIARIRNTAEMNFRRKAFENAALDYIEGNVVSPDTSFESFEAIERCNVLLNMEFIDYPYRANAVRTKVLLMNLDSAKDEKLLELMGLLSKDRISKERMEVYLGVMVSVVKHLEICTEVGAGDEKMLLILREYVDEYREYLPDNVYPE